MDSLLIQLITGTVIGFGAGYLGAFMVLRRMSLVGDALSHVALPGIAVALILQTNPFYGAFVALFLAILGIWLIEKRSGLPSETLVGIFFTVSLALGLLLTPEPELLEALLGDITKISRLDMWLAIVLTIIALLLMQRISKGIMLGIISKDLTESLGISVHRMNLIFLLLVAVIVALGLKVAGTLLMGSLVIVPAAAARNVSRALAPYTFLASFFGGFSAFAGIIGAYFLDLNPGPIVVLVSGLLFLGTLPFKRLT